MARRGDEAPVMAFLGSMQRKKKRGGRPRAWRVTRLIKEKNSGQGIMD